MPYLTDIIFDYFPKDSTTEFESKSKCIPASEKVIRKYGDGGVKLPPDIDKIIETARKNVASKEPIHVNDLRHLALALLSRSFEDNLARSVLAQIDNAGTRRHFSALFTTYILEFDSENKICLAIAKVLKKNKTKLSKNWLNRLEKIDLLDCNNVVKKISTAMLAEKLNEQQFFFKSGLTGALAAGNLAQSCIEQLGVIVRNKASAGNQSIIDDYIKIVTDGNGIRNEAKRAAMVGLLGPFLNTSPSSYLKNRLLSIFINSFSDPRLSSVNWPEIPANLGGDKFRDQCIGTVKKWLILETIELFFEVIAECAPEQFDARQKLWRAYFKQDHVREAHVILGRDAIRLVKQKQLDDPDEATSSLHYGRFTSGQVTSDQSVLLMRIGDLTVAEWSHNGKFRAWNDNADADAIPQFYKTEYAKRELMAGCNPILQRNGKMGNGIVHLGNWVDYARMYINSETGIRLTRG